MALDVFYGSKLARGLDLIAHCHIAPMLREEWRNTSNLPSGPFWPLVGWNIYCSSNLCKRCIEFVDTLYTVKLLSFNETTKLVAKIFFLLIPLFLHFVRTLSYGCLTTLTADHNTVLLLLLLHQTQDVYINHILKRSANIMTYQLYI